MLEVLILRCFSVFLIALVLSYTSSAEEFQIGSGMADITGPAAGQEMLGYADIQQTTGGIHTRLLSRAFIIVKSDSARPNLQTRVALVTIDQAMMFSNIKAQVLIELEKEFSGLYTESNVLISATHTHSAPGGISHYSLYNISTFGFDQRNFDTIVHGIVQSVRSAHHNLKRGRIKITEGELVGVSTNRAPQAYRANRDQGLYSHSTDTSNVLIRFTTQDGNEIGEMNWFGVHPVSMSKRNHLISSDNSGYASLLFEREMEKKYSRKGFVAAFVNSNEGDSSPNIDETRDLSDEEKTKYIGTQRFNKALELFVSASEILSDRLEFRHVWVDMPNYRLDASSDEGGSKTLCQPALGLSFAAGAPDGLSDVPGYFAGMKQGSESNATWIDFAASHLIKLVGGNRSGNECHYPKPIFIASVNSNSYLMPHVIPMQLVVIGELAVAAVPAEFTTMSGRRLKKQILKELAGTGVRYVVISGLANEYSGYVATPEEYSEQYYEGASTLYGPHTLEGYMRVFSQMAESIRETQSISLELSPRFVTSTNWNYHLPVFFDFKWPKESFGQVLQEPNKTYGKNSVVNAKFLSGHPSNSVGFENKFVEVEYWDETQWLSVSRDGDLETTFSWERDSYALMSTINVYWNTAHAQEGTYRIRHFGYSKSLTGKYIPYEGVTQNFSVGSTLF